MTSIFISVSKRILLLLAFVILREEARRRYVAGALWPYSSDPVLAGPNSFCNVRREDDRVSRWQAEFVRGRYGGTPEYWPRAFAFRAFNRIEVGEAFFVHSDAFDAVLATNDAEPFARTLWLAYRARLSDPWA
jgi:hypothetical protein